MKEFVNYLYTMRFLSTANRSIKNLVISIVYALGLALVLQSMNTESVLPLLTGIAGFCSAHYVFWTRKMKPNINTLLPITPQKRTVFELLSVPALFVLISAFILAIMFVVQLLVTFLILVTTLDSEYLFESMLDVYAENFTGAFYNVYSSLILIFGVLYIIGASMIYSHTGSFKKRTVTAVGMFAYAAAGAQIILQLSIRSHYRGSGVRPPYYFFGNAGYYMADGKFAWLAILIIALSGCISLAVGVYLTIKSNRPQKF